MGEACAAKYLSYIYDAPNRAEILLIGEGYLIRITLDTTKIIPSYYWIFAQSDAYWRQAISLVGGTGQPQFNANVIKRLKVTMPPLEKQKEIIEQIEAEQKLIEPNSEIITTFKNKIQEKLNFIWGK